MEPYRLVGGADGTHALFYPVFNSSVTSGTLWGRVRNLYGHWSKLTNISVIPSPIKYWENNYWDAGVSPEGTAWVVWTHVDSSAPAGKEVFVVTSFQPPGGTWSAPEKLSTGNKAVRWVDFTAGPDGQIAAAWSECDTTTTSLENGNYKVFVSRRTPSNPAWIPPKRVDASSEGVNEVYALAGPDGLVVVIWTESAASLYPPPPRWFIKANEYKLASGWGSTPAFVSSVVQPRQPRLLGDPVMDGTGTVTAAWYTASPPGSNNSAIYSNTRTNTTGWGTNLVQICADTQDTLIDPLMAVGENGDVAAIWWRSNSNPIKPQAVFANARDAGGTWGASDERISDYVDELKVYSLDIWPNGTAVGLWSARDKSRPSAGDEGVFWSSRYNSVWGAGGQGQLGDWVDRVMGASLQMSRDGSAAAVWSVNDPKLMYAVLASLWPPGGPWGKPQTIKSGYSFVQGPWNAVVRSAEVGDFGAAWMASNSTSPLQTAYFYATTQDLKVFLPLSTK